jgi:chitin-binding protein
LDWSIYLPDSLQGTTGFTHIMQLKMPGNGSAPILTMDLTRRGSAQRIQVKIFDAGIVIGATDLVPLHNTWLDSRLTFTIADAPAGAVSWRLSKAGSTLVDASKTGVDTWLQDRVRPKWGIYRSVQGFQPPYPLGSCSMLITNMRAYKKG